MRFRFTSEFTLIICILYVYETPQARCVAARVDIMVFFFFLHDLDECRWGFYTVSSGLNENNNKNPPDLSRPFIKDLAS